jgi:hypothetical protein
MCEETIEICNCGLLKDIEKKKERKRKNCLAC